MVQLPPKLSLGPADAQELLRFLELRLDVDGCDNSHSHTRSWAGAEDLDPEQVVEFVKRHGGFHCDVAGRRRSGLGDGGSGRARGMSRVVFLLEPGASLRLPLLK